MASTMRGKIQRGGTRPPHIEGPVHEIIRERKEKPGERKEEANGGIASKMTSVAQRTGVGGKVGQRTLKKKRSHRRSEVCSYRNTLTIQKREEEGVDRSSACSKRSQPCEGPQLGLQKRGNHKSRLRLTRDCARCEHIKSRKIPGKTTTKRRDSKTGSWVSGRE